MTGTLATAIVLGAVFVSGCTAAAVASAHRFRFVLRSVSLLRITVLVAVASLCAMSAIGQRSVWMLGVWAFMLGLCAIAAVGDVETRLIPVEITYLCWLVAAGLGVASPQAAWVLVTVLGCGLVLALLGLGGGDVLLLPPVAAATFVSCGTLPWSTFVWVFLAAAMLLALGSWTGGRHAVVPVAPGIFAAAALVPPLVSAAQRMVSFG